jgi:hypothetical protein
MPTRKIRDYEDINPKYKVCRHPEHKPPMHVVYEPGEWERVCPGVATS